MENLFEKILRFLQSDGSNAGVHSGWRLEHSPTLDGVVAIGCDTDFSGTVR